MKLRIKRKIKVQYDKFLVLCKRMYEKAQTDKFMNPIDKELMTIDTSEGLVLARRFAPKEFIVVKIGVGTQEQLRQIFHESE